jgi:drug/metabolite transporter (DMT)-like permease
VHFFYSLLVGMIASCNQIIFNLSLQYEDASKISIIKTTELFFIFLMQYLFLNIKTDYLNMIGAFLILTSTLIIILYKIFDQIESEKRKLNLKTKKEIQSIRLLKKILFFKF